MLENRLLRTGFGSFRSCVLRSNCHEITRLIFRPDKRVYLGAKSLRFLQHIFQLFGCLQPLRRLHEEIYKWHRSSTLIDSQLRAGDLRCNRCLIGSLLVGIHRNLGFASKCCRKSRRLQRCELGSRILFLVRKIIDLVQHLCLLRLGLVDFVLSSLQRIIGDILEFLTHLVVRVLGEFLLQILELILG